MLVRIQHSTTWNLPNGKGNRLENCKVTSIATITNYLHMGEWQNKAFITNCLQYFISVHAIDIGSILCG